jgi:hypothetical protein
VTDAAALMPPLVSTLAQHVALGSLTGTVSDSGRNGATIRLIRVP